MYIADSFWTNGLASESTRLSMEEMSWPQEFQTPDSRRVGVYLHSFICNVLHVA
jgi:hypothetical protein